MESCEDKSTNVAQFQYRKISFSTRTPPNGAKPYSTVVAAKNSELQTVTPLLTVFSLKPPLKDCLICLSDVQKDGCGKFAHSEEDKDQMACKFISLTTRSTPKIAGTEPRAEKCTNRITSLPESPTMRNARSRAKRRLRRCGVVIQIKTTALRILHVLGPSPRPVTHGSSSLCTTHLWKSQQITVQVT